ncbi:MAG TPA: copper amine oxidase N-terminal domain-containing protein, partial [Candidatus Cryosericum sp.]|nr:copper amine oxidase N-terminal domain-containing protein [Candidatus Cryosericum sp.]
RLQVGNKTAMVNDASKTLQAAPVNVKGVVNVPLRFIGEAFGATVEWEPVFKIVRIQLGTTTIYLQVGSNYASVNGKKVVLQGVPTIVSGTTMVPIRFISEAFGAEVVWTEATKGITITYPKP